MRLIDKDALLIQLLDYRNKYMIEGYPMIAKIIGEIADEVRTATEYEKENR